MLAVEDSLPKTFSFEEIENLICYDDREGLKAALEHDNFDVNIKGQHGGTVLHSAAWFDKVEILEMLLNETNANINVKDGCFHTPLISAVIRGKVRSVKFLLEKGADASYADSLGMTALFHACAYKNRLEIVELLLKTKNCTPKSETKVTSYDFMYNDEVIELLKRLIIESSDDDPYYLNTFGCTILYHGCRGGSLDTVKFIMERNILNVNVRSNKCKFTPLHFALCGRSFLDIADYLIQKGAKLSIKDNFGRTVYDLAALYDKSERFLEKYEPEERFLGKMFEALVEKFRYKTLRAYAEKCTTGKYPNGPSILNKALSFALEKKCIGSLINLLPFITDKDLIVKLLIKAIHSHKYIYFGPLYERFLELETENERIKVVDNSLFIDAMGTGNKIVVDYFLERGLDPNEADDGNSFLIRACAMNISTDIVESLIKHGAEVYRSDQSELSALSHATLRNNMENVRLLLSYGAKPHSAKPKDFTPLIIAASSGFEELFFELLAKDRNNYKWADAALIAPLFAACSSGSLPIIKALEEKGAYLEDVDDKYRNCLHFAVNASNMHELMLYIFERIGKKEFMVLITSVDNEGNRPVDVIIRDKSHETIMNLLTAIPDLKDLISAPNYIMINNDISDQEHQEMCLICRDDFVNGDSALVLQCKHMFHTECFSEWSKQKGVCPYCQRPAHSVIK